MTTLAPCCAASNTWRSAVAKWKEIPSPEAIVRAALERAAQAVQMCIWGDHWRHDDFGDVEPEELADVIRSFADDPAEVAAIIKKAGEDRR